MSLGPTLVFSNGCYKWVLIEHSVKEYFPCFSYTPVHVVRKDMDVNEHERLSNIRHRAFIAALHFIVTVRGVARI
jgi:hypothetical protein